MKNVLAIGGSGFIGSRLAERLRQKGYDITACSRKECNLLMPDSLKKASSNMDTVFCAANDFNNVYKLHTEGIRNLIKACRDNNVGQLIYFSSIAVFDEDKNDYSLAKIEAEKILNEASKSNEFKIIIVRPPGVFGERGLGPLGKIIFFAKKGIVPVLGTGGNLQSVTYVGNVANQVILLAEKNVPEGSYITTDDRAYAVNELIDAVCKTMNRRVLKIHIPLLFIKPFINNPSIKAIIEDRVFNQANIFKELGYVQEYDLGTAVKQTINWYNKKDV